MSKSLGKGKPQLNDLDVSSQLPYVFFTQGELWVVNGQEGLVR